MNWYGSGFITILIYEIFAPNVINPIPNDGFLLLDGTNFLLLNDASFFLLLM